MNEKTKSNLKYLAIGWVIIIILFTYIEIISPYNFTKDDNFGQFLPTILQGFKIMYPLDLYLAVSIILSVLAILIYITFIKKKKIGEKE